MILSDKMPIADTPQASKNVFLVEPLLGQFEEWLKSRHLHLGRIPGLETWIVTFDEDHPAILEWKAEHADPG